MFVVQSEEGMNEPKSDTRPTYEKTTSSFSGFDSGQHHQRASPENFVVAGLTTIVFPSVEYIDLCREQMSQMHDLVQGWSSGMLVRISL